MLREGPYRGVGELIETNGGDMAEMAKKAGGGGKKRPGSASRGLLAVRASRLH